MHKRSKYNVRLLETKRINRKGNSKWLDETGDGAKMDESGYVFIVDRVKDMIISGGENIYSTEVENTIYQLKDVLECAVIGIPDENGEKLFMQFLE